MISTVIFDLSDVYLGGMFGIEEKIEKIVGKKIPTNSLHREKETEAFFHGEITEDEYWQKLIDKFAWENVDVTMLKTLVRSQMTEIAGTRQIMERLSKNGYKLGLLSVNAKEWVEHYEKTYDYHKLFHSRLYSYEVGVCKPEPEAYELILQRLNVAPQDCVFIDDTECNVQAAQALGMQAIQFKNAQQLEQDLADLQLFTS